MTSEKLSNAVIGERLRKIRGIRTRIGVAKEVGITPSRLGNYELGYSCPPDDIKIRLANYYGVSVESLFYASEYQET